jgi:hypothetical protein
MDDDNCRYISNLRFKAIIWWCNGTEQIESRHRIMHALLNPILDELMKEGKITITAGEHGELISLKD